MMSAAAVYAHQVPKTSVMMEMCVQTIPVTLSMDAQTQTIITSVMMVMPVPQETYAIAVYAYQAPQPSVTMAMYVQTMPATLSMDAQIQTIITPVMMEILLHSMIHALAG